MQSKTSMKGQGVASLGITLVIVAVTLVIGVLVFSQIFNSLPVLAGTANTTAVTIQTTTMNAFNLGSISLIVLAAVTILSIIFLLGRRA